MEKERFNILIGKLRRHDEEAFRELYNSIMKLIARHVKVKYRGLGIEGEDIGHEFFEKLIRSKRIEYVENPIRWLYAVTDRIVINFLNRKYMPVEELTEYSCVEDSFAEYIERKDLVERLRKFDEKGVMLLYMRSAEGYSLKDIAEMWNVTYGTLKMRLYRAKQRLRELLEREEKRT